MKRNLLLQRLIVLVSIFLLLLKFAAYFITQSNAILSDALESIVNVSAALLGFYSIWLSAQPRDVKHPYGHGKIEFLTAAVEGSLILFAGLLIIGKSIYNFFQPQTLTALDTGLLLLMSTAAINFVLGRLAVQQGRKSFSPALTASGRHLEADALSTAGVGLGLLLILWYQTSWLDNSVAIAFGTWIIRSGWKVLRPAIAGIMDESDMELLTQMVDALNRHRRATWVDLHNMRAIKYGSLLHVDCHVTVPWYYNVKQAHAELEIVNKEMQQVAGRPVELFIHTDACVPEKQCALCLLSDCAFRQHPFVQRTEWTLQTTLANRKHGM